MLPLAFALLAVGEKFPPWLDLALRLDRQIQERGGTTASVTTKAIRVVRKSKNQIIVEYALRDTNKPMGVSTYQLQDALPSQLQGSLPTVEELEAELEAVFVEPEDEV